MGLFQGKQQVKQSSQTDDAAENVLHFFDEHYREELRASGREYFVKAMTESAAHFKQDLDNTIVKVNAELTDYMTKRLDETIARVDSELVKRLDARLSEYDKLTQDAQDQAVQSLNRNAQALHEKYQQLGKTLEQTVASQEVMMINVFEENKARITATQGSQDVILEGLKNSAQASLEQTKQLGTVLQKSVTDQEASMTDMFEQSKSRITATQSAQESALHTLTDSAKKLQEQHDQLSATLEKTIADQQAMMVDVFQNNMARIIEHYVLGALGDQYDMKAQLPGIIQQMEANKQAIMDDMKL